MTERVSTAHRRLAYKSTVWLPMRMLAIAKVEVCFRPHVRDQDRARVMFEARAGGCAPSR